MLVRELMTKPAIAVRPHLTIKNAVRRLERHHISAMPVLDDGDRLIGIVSEADLLRDAVVDDPRAHAKPTESLHEDPPAAVEDVMTPHVITVHENSDVAEVARLMLETGIKSIPVVRADKVVGVISRSDVIHALATTDARIRDEIVVLLREAGLHTWTISVDDGDVSVFGDGGPSDRKVVETLARTARGVRSVHVVPSQRGHVPTRHRRLEVCHG